METFHTVRHKRTFIILYFKIFSGGAITKTAQFCDWNTKNCGCMTEQISAEVEMLLSKNYFTGVHKICSCLFHHRFLHSENVTVCSTNVYFFKINETMCNLQMVNDMRMCQKPSSYYNNLYCQCSYCRNTNGVVKTVP